MSFRPISLRLLSHTSRRPSAIYAYLNTSRPAKRLERRRIRQSQHVYCHKRLFRLRNTCRFRFFTKNFVPFCSFLFCFTSKTLYKALGRFTYFNQSKLLYLFNFTCLIVCEKKNTLRTFSTDNFKRVNSRVSPIKFILKYL